MTTNKRGQERHDLITSRLDALLDSDAIEAWRYEKAAQRYIVDLGEEVDLQGGTTPTNLLVMTLMSVEAFLAGVLVAQRLGYGARVFVVDAEGGVSVE